MEKLRISELLHNMGLSFTELSHKIDIKRTTLIYLLKRKEISMQHLLAISNILQCSISDLFEDEQELIISGILKYEDMTFDLRDLDDYSNFIRLLCDQFGFQADIKMELSE